MPEEGKAVGCAAEDAHFQEEARSEGRGANAQEEAVVELQEVVDFKRLNTHRLHGNDTGNRPGTYSASKPVGQAVLVGRQDGKESVTGFIHQGHVDVVRVPGEENVVDQVHRSWGLFHGISQPEDGCEKGQTCENEFADGLLVKERNEKDDQEGGSCGGFVEEEVKGQHAQEGDGPFAFEGVPFPPKHHEGEHEVHGVAGVGGFGIEPPYPATVA